MTKVKICGITNIKDAQAAIKYGASALGFIFYKKSPRHISPENAAKIIKQVPPFVTTVGVFVNEKEKSIRSIARLTGIQVIQFHGDETPDFCRKFSGFKTIKAFRIKDDLNLKGLNQYSVDAYLFDTYQGKVYGGSGISFNWKLFSNKKFLKPIILSGGLKPNNIREAIKIVFPYAVDVSSGVEKSPGIKNHQLIKRFIDLTKAYWL